CFQAEDGIRDRNVTGVQTCALPISKARYNQKSPKEILADRSKKLRKSVYEIDESMKVKFPSKSATNELGDEIEYCQKLMNVIENEEAISQYPKVKEKLNLLK